MSPAPPLKLRFCLVVIVCGLLASVATGTINNETGLGIPETSQYGYPLPWLIADLNGPTSYLPGNFLIDSVFWVGISMATLLFLHKFAFPALGVVLDWKKLRFLVVVLLPLGIFMALMHEMGHAAWGTILGGRLTYMKLAFLEIYPTPSLTPTFVLGLTRVEELVYGSPAYGLMLLGGPMTTNLAAWILGGISVASSNKTQHSVKLLGIFGMLDLPFYIVFPQLGLRHWIFIGGNCGPEPLVGARMIGIPDSVLYLVVAISTFGLLLVYSETFRKRLLVRLAFFCPPS
jgi:hypothetical protein